MELKVNEKELVELYQESTEETKKKLLHVFGKGVFKRCIPVTERIKTFEDAIAELGESNVLVKEYMGLCSGDGVKNISKDIEAYLKLRIVVSSYNEGWEPQFDKGEYRYYPWFWLYTQEEWNELNEEEKENGVFFGGDATRGAACGFLFASTHYAPSRTYAYIGSRLCFKTRELAQCAAKRFAHIWLDFNVYIPDADGTNKLKVKRNKDEK